MSAGRISEELRARIETQAKGRCGYCLSAQRYVLGRLEIEHLIPRARGGSDDEENLWLSCRLCNGFKGTRTHGFDPVSGASVRLFDPRRQRWSEHFAWSEDGVRILGQTPAGRATVIALQLNHALAVAVRQAWVAAGWHPPQEEPGGR